MKTHIKPTILLFIPVISILISLTACEKFLEERPPSAPSSEDYFNNATEAESSLNGIYRPLANNGLWGSTEMRLFVLSEISTDNAAMGPGGVNPNAASVEIDNHNYTPANNHLQDVWANMYAGINRANFVLEEVPRVSMEESFKNRILGEASFLRALYYFYLVQLFGDVPLLLESSKDFSSRPARTPAAQVYQQIEQDLQFAETAIDVNRHTGNTSGRVSRVAAKALLAKVYLTQGKWAEAAGKAREVIQTPGYRLWPDFTDVFNLPANENQGESIFEVQYNQDGGISSRSMIKTTPRNERVGSDQGHGDWVATADLYNIYSSRDRRRTTYSGANNFVLNPADPAQTPFFTRTNNAWYLRKFRDYSLRDRNTNNNFIVLRLADMYLVLAEALNELQGPDREAILAYNAIRKRAGLNMAIDTLTFDPILISQAGFRDSVLVERRRELAFEGHRWFDLVRTGRLVEAVKDVKPAATISERNVLYPIPQSEIDINPNLTQNNY
jgi:starch-binding outer membrane protein, SusD/RagB family